MDETYNVHTYSAYKKSTPPFYCIQCRGSYESLHTERTTRGAGDKRGGRGKEKTVGNRAMRRSEEGRGMGQGTQGKQDGHEGDFQEGKQGI